MGSKLVPRASASGRQREKRGFGKRQSLQSVDCRLCMFRNVAWTPFGRSQIDAAALLVVDDIVGLALFGLYLSLIHIFLNPQNITNLISQNAYVFILATGMLLCILTGGNIDLSVGSVVCFTGAIGALLMAGGMNMWLAVVIMLVIGLAIGAFQAYWIAYVRVPPFITTLAGMLIFRGLSNVALNGRTQSISCLLYTSLRRSCKATENPCRGGSTKAVPAMKWNGC